MPMYHWSSDTRFSSYTSGDIIVYAESPEEARELALAEHDRQFGDDWTKERMQLQEDMLDDPTVEDVLFIYGSD